MKRGLEPIKALKIGLSNRELILRYILVCARTNYINCIFEEWESFIDQALETYNNTIAHTKSNPDYKMGPGFPFEDPEDIDRDYYGETLNFWPSREGEREWLEVKMAEFTEKYKKMAEGDRENIDKY